MKLEGRRKSKNINDTRGITLSPSKQNRQVAAIRATAKRSGVKVPQAMNDLEDYAKARQKKAQTRSDRIPNAFDKMKRGIPKALSRIRDAKLKKAR